MFACRGLRLPRKLRVLLFGLLLLLLIPTVWHYSSPYQKIDRGFKNPETQSKLKSAKTLQEFEVILGKPGNYSARTDHYYFTNVCTKGMSFDGGQDVMWQDDYAMIVAYFRTDGVFWSPWFAIDQPP